MGAQIVADGSSGQILIYSGTPATGNLIGSWSGASGSDGFSNNYPAGQAATTLTMYGAATPPTPPAMAATLFSNTVGSIGYISASGFSGIVPQALGNVTSASNATATPGHLTVAWSIPANDAGLGTCYRLKVWGIASNSSSGNNIGMQIAGFGYTNQANAHVNAVTAGTNIQWSVECIILVISLGAGGSAIFSTTFNLQGYSVEVGTSASAQAIDTTSPTTFQLFGNWNGGSGYSVTGLCSTLERI
jgi:hypothetical protein